MELTEIPDATTTDAALIGCPVDDCGWTCAVPWSEIDPETGGTDHRFEYQAHYAAEHRTSVLGVLAPGTVLVLPTELIEAQPEDQRDLFVQRIMVELHRVARHDQFTVLFADGDLRLLDESVMNELGWTRTGLVLPSGSSIGI